MVEVEKEGFIGWILSSIFNIEDLLTYSFYCVFGPCPIHLQILQEDLVTGFRTC